MDSLLDELNGLLSKAAKLKCNMFFNLGHSYFFRITNDYISITSSVPDDYDVVFNANELLTVNKGHAILLVFKHCDVNPDKLITLLRKEILLRS